MNRVIESCMSAFGRYRSGEHFSRPLHGLIEFWLRWSQRWIAGLISVVRWRGRCLRP